MRRGASRLPMPEVGQKFNLWEVIGYDGSKPLCRCSGPDCEGTTRSIPLAKLYDQLTKGCRKCRRHYPRRMPTNIDRAKRFLALHKDQQLSCRKIGERHGVGPSTVSQTLRRYFPSYDTRTRSGSTECPFEGVIQ